MTLWSPDLPTMYTYMQKRNSSVFWTGFERFNRTFFYEKSSRTYSNCRINPWFSALNKVRYAFKIGVTLTQIQKMMKYPTTQFCDSWEWDRNLIAIVIDDRFAGYQRTSDYRLSATDCLCYKFIPSTAYIIAYHKKVVGYTVFGVLRKV